MLPASSGIDWDAYAAFGTTTGEGDSRKTVIIYGLWTVSISHGHGMRPGKVIKAAVDEWKGKGGISDADASKFSSGHDGGRPFNPDITVYGISENEITARILEDLFDKLDIENGHGNGTHERSIYAGGIKIVYRCRVIQAQHFVGVGTYFLERG